MAGLSLDILANTSDFIRGTKDVDKALDKVADSLDDTARDGDQATEKLERSFKELANAAKKEGDAAGRGLSNGIGDGAVDAAQGVEVLESKSQKALGRIAGAFDGGFEDIASSAQRLSSVAFSGFGPAGVLAGAAAAAGLGVITQTITDVQTAAEALSERISAAYQAAAEDGRSALDEAQITAAALDIIFSDQREKVEQEAAKIGLDASTYIRALAGDQDALTLAIEKSGTKAQELRDKLEGAVGAQGDSLLLYDKSTNAAGQINEKLIKQQQLMNENKAAAELALEIQNKNATAVDLTNEALGRTPKSITVPITADTSALDNKLSESRTVKVQLEGYTRNGMRVI